MASVIYQFGISNAGTYVTGLTPTVILLKKLSDNTNVSTIPTVTEIGLGQYKIAYDHVALGEAACVIDAGSSISLGTDRYIPLSLGGQVLKDDYVPAVTGNVTGSYADTFVAARAQGFGKWSISGDILYIYAPDTTTVVATLPITRDSSGLPVSRG